MARPRGTGSLRRRGGVWWVRYWHNGERIEESTKTTNHKKAGDFLRERMRTAGTPSFFGPKAEQVSFAAPEALIVRDYGFKKNRSTKRLAQSLAHLREVFGLDKALTILAERIEQYAEQRLAVGAQAARVNCELAALRRMFRLALKKRLLPSMPVITLLKVDNVREGFVEPADFDALLMALRARGEPDVADAAEFAYLALTRRANVIGALWAWFTLTIEGGAVVGGTVRLPGAVTKNGKPLPLALRGRLLDLVRRRWALRVPACPYVFHRDGRRIVTFDGVWTAACAEAGLAGLHFHDLRRSGARNLRRAGVAEDVIMRIGGWKTRSMFSRYNIIDETDLAAAANAYDAFLDRALAAGRKVVPLKTRNTV